MTVAVALATRGWNLVVAGAVIVLLSFLLAKVVPKPTNPVALGRWQGIFIGRWIGLAALVVGVVLFVLGKS
jgi:hypothetical protein